MLTENILLEPRTLTPSAAVAATANQQDPDLGLLALLPGTWQNSPDLIGRGWNMIALPFAGGVLPFRLLVNQFNEVLSFPRVDKHVPNRGIGTDATGATVETDQSLIAIDYGQEITQFKGDDFPQSGLPSQDGLIIHHEKGMWLLMQNQVSSGFDIARLGTIPHGDTIVAIGNGSSASGAPQIPQISGLPFGVDAQLDQDRANGVPLDLDKVLANPYFAPYQNFHRNLFQGLFDPTLPAALLAQANVGVVINNTTTLDVDTTRDTGGIINIPFVVKQASATQMHAQFWIQELAQKDKNGDPVLRLQYLQVVMLEFFPAVGGKGLIKWPHVSINTLEKVVI